MAVMDWLIRLAWEPNLQQGGLEMVTGLMRSFRIRTKNAKC